jgi:predicted nucleotidyltransferase
MDGMSAKQIETFVPRDRIVDFCRKWRVSELALFGSVLRDDFRADSDIDILVTFSRDVRWSLFDWIDMIDELRSMFGREIHLLSRGGLRNPFRRHEILKTREVVYAA